MSLGPLTAFKIPGAECTFRIMCGKCFSFSHTDLAEFYRNNPDNKEFKIYFPLNDNVDHIS
jgi:hypothetical protein